MSGPVEWNVLIFIGGLLCAAVVASWVASWRVRSLLADEHLSNELRLASLEKDVRHIKANLKQHGEINAEMFKDIERLKFGTPKAKR